MKIHALILAFGGIVGAAAIAQAQPAAAPADPLADAQGVFGQIVGDAFHRPDPVVNAASTPGGPGSALGGALKASLEGPGAVWVGIMKPFADADAAANPAPVAAPAPAHHRHAHAHHRHVPA